MFLRALLLANLLPALLCVPVWLCAAETGQPMHAPPVPVVTAAKLASNALLQEQLPPPAAAAGDFPPLPPDPYAEELDPLPPLEEELYLHGGSYLYQPEGDRLGWPEPCEPSNHQVLRLPEDWCAPQPFTRFAEFHGADPIQSYCHLKWPGCGGYSWEPRLVGHGSYELFGFALEQNNQRQDVLGHQLLLDLDLQLTGTERFHLQYRPIGEKNTGGSYYQFSEPSGYVDNSNVVPDRYWFECEIGSVLGAYLDPFAATDYNLVLGKFPYALHNNLLMNDEILGFVFSKNNTYVGNLSNFNWQVFAGYDDVDAFDPHHGSVYGGHLIMDHRHVYWELTYAFLQHGELANANSHYFGVSRTAEYGLWNYAARAFFKFGEEAARGNGQLYVLETNTLRYFQGKPLGVEYGVFYGNAFYASADWSSISGGNFNRLRLAFESNPLVRISAAPPVDDTFGLALGVRLFRHHEDEALVPEFGYQSIGGTGVYGFGLRYQIKTGPRSFLEVLGVVNHSDDDRFQREGIFASQTIVF